MLVTTETGTGSRNDRPRVFGLAVERCEHKTRTHRHLGSGAPPVTWQQPPLLVLVYYGLSTLSIRQPVLSPSSNTKSPIDERYELSMVCQVKYTR